MDLNYKNRKVLMVYGAMIDLNYGNLIRRIRKELGWSQEKLGEKIHCSQQNITKMEKNSKPPSWDVCEQLRSVTGREDFIDALASPEKYISKGGKAMLSHSEGNQHTYIVACNADPTCIVVAKSKTEAEKIASKQFEKEFGLEDNSWEAYPVDEYFDDEETMFFGWIVHDANTDYLK